MDGVGAAQYEEGGGGLAEGGGGKQQQQEAWQIMVVQLLQQVVLGQAVEKTKGQPGKTPEGQFFQAAPRLFHHI